mmetsp:Transcript_91204/g.242219  ORF Transcript_91204/g.242219 Transcript_91204/m.242219 type:complete len:334 (+) Transcript_91204:166-1167(+)
MISRMLALAAKVMAKPSRLDTARITVTTTPGQSSMILGRGFRSPFFRRLAANSSNSWRFSLVNAPLSSLYPSRPRAENNAGMSPRAIASMVRARLNLSFDVSWRTRPKSKRTGTAPAGEPGCNCNMKLPGCGSAWKSPSRKIMMPNASTMLSSTRRGSMLCSARTAALEKLRSGIASMNSIVRTRRAQKSPCVCGTTTGLPKLPSVARTCFSASASARKSSSRGCVVLSSSSNGRKSKLGSSLATRLTMIARVPRSSLIRRSTPSCCTFTATVSPLWSVARCTCAMEAEPMAGVLKSRKTSLIGRPKSVRNTRRISAMGLSGSWSVNKENSLM